MILGKFLRIFRRKISNPYLIPIYLYPEFFEFISNNHNKFKLIVQKRLWKPHHDLMELDFFINCDYQYQKDLENFIKILEIRKKKKLFEKQFLRCQNQVHINFRTDNEIDDLMKIFTKLNDIIGSKNWFVKSLNYFPPHDIIGIMKPASIYLDIDLVKTRNLNLYRLVLMNEFDLKRII